MQGWTLEDRNELVRFIDERSRTAIDEKGSVTFEDTVIVYSWPNWPTWRVELVNSIAHRRRDPPGPIEGSCTATLSVDSHRADLFLVPVSNRDLGDL